MLCVERAMFFKNGYITLEQANRYYGLDKRSESG
jgi:hypothetical protein